MKSIPTSTPAMGTATQQWEEDEGSQRQMSVARKLEHGIMLRERKTECDERKKYIHGGSP